MMAFTYELDYVSRDVRVYSVFHDGKHVGSIRRFMASWPRKVKGAPYTMGTSHGVRFTPYSVDGQRVAHQYDTRSRAAQALINVSVR